MLLQTLANVGYEGVASLKCHGTAGWPLDKVTAEMGAAAMYIRERLPDGAR